MSLVLKTILHFVEMKMAMISMSRSFGKAGWRMNFLMMRMRILLQSPWDCGCL